MQTIAESLASLKGATIESVTAKISKDGLEFDCLVLFLADGRKVELWSYVTRTGNDVFESESSLDIEIN